MRPSHGQFTKNPMFERTHWTSALPVPLRTFSFLDGRDVGPQIRPSTAIGGAGAAADISRLEVA